MLTPIIFPYKLGSASAKALATELGCLRVRSNGRYRPRENHLIINWGNGLIPNWPLNLDQVLNNPTCVRLSSDKIECLEILLEANVEVPEFCYDVRMAQRLIEEGYRVFCRTLTRASSGRGIVIAESPNELVNSPLYTVDVGKRREYRVHVFNGEIIDFAQKKKLTSEQLEERGITYNRDIRSHDNGWVFARDGVDLPEEVGSVALRAITALGLDFGAVDCYLTSRDNPNPQVAGVFEVNSAPGFQEGGTTVKKYVDAIQNIQSQHYEK